ncbi:MAG: beta-xylosidase [Ferruginibacter sp.]|uniref:glycoside hydrolase family 43 protein n=1 Tax=Ferruginibacter sp. TaxID=1940288 RepID=UPI0026587163|nr:glycoside hydrolase family 43 protein [Ferruginibacter sp.]MDB5280234.1 beta-xylosidase [Ferruginibacter sp.]
MTKPVATLFLFCLTLQCIVFFTPLQAQQRVKPVIAGDFADPSIIRVGSTYYAVGTSSEWAPHFPVYISTDLKNWKHQGYIFNKAPEWTAGSFWAPEYYKIGNTYYLYYTARRKKDSVSYIGVATSRYPDKGFVDHGVIVDFGKEAIDAFVYNDMGQLYITFKAYGLDNRPIELLGSKLSKDGLKLEGSPFSLMKDEPRMGMEGQSILKKGDLYYLFYSAGNCCGATCSYNVRVARSKKFTGPYENFTGNPLLQGGGDFTCTGHGTFVNTAGGKYYYLHHAYSNKNGVFTGRQGMLAELVWPNNNGWPAFKETETAPAAPAAINDLFNNKLAAKYWQWDFRNAMPVVQQRNGSLFLSGTARADNQTGIVLTVRPVSDSFDITTTVVNHNNVLKGLAFYGDANAAVGVGTIGGKVVFWEVRSNKRNILAEAAISSTLPVQLKLTMKPDATTLVYYRQGKEQWKLLPTAQPVSVQFLPQWDRSPRAGLHFKGGPTEQAQFSEFSFKSY